jgi:hypothetical protein
MEEGVVKQSDIGTPQGGIISPVLANIYLYYSLDLWFEKVFRKECNVYARLIRYADDFVVCFQQEADAMKFRTDLEGRLARFGLKISPEKTKVIEFGPIAEIKAKREGGKPQTFDFLGFTHYCSRTRDKKRFRMKRKTSGKKFKAAVRRTKEWLNRRGKRGCVNYEKFNRLLEKFPLPAPRIRVSLWPQRVKPRPYRQMYLFLQP